MAYMVKLIISLLSITYLCYAKTERMSFETPKLTDEEKEYTIMPKQYRCEACRGISSQMQQTLTKKINIFPSVREGKKDLTEGQLLDLFEELCQTEDVFSVKTVEGKLQLIYPGSEYDDYPGMRMGGGMWNRRFADMCMGFVGDHEEMPIYHAHRADTVNGIFNLLCPKLCKDEKKNQKEEL